MTYDDICVKSEHMHVKPQESRKAVGLDIRMSPDLDILSSTGFLQHIYQLCRVKPGSGFLGAPVCSTFVVVNLILKLEL